MSKNERKGTADSNAKNQNQKATVKRFINHFILNLTCGFPLLSTVGENTSWKCGTFVTVLSIVYLSKVLNFIKSFHFQLTYYFINF